jgi:FtsP/CotA-like multicopper oxidase with cupredoxin domain
VEILNETSHEEFVHWHGLSVLPAQDGTQEELSSPVPAYGRLRYSLCPQTAGLRWIHSHVMLDGRLDRGVFSGQYGMVYVKPAQDSGRYDREFFLTMHEWGAEKRWVPQAGEDEEDRGAPGSSTIPVSGSWEIQYDIGSINGKALGAGEPLRVRQGERVLLHLLNASATVSQRIAIAGHSFLVFALDGYRVPRAQRCDVLDLAVGERISAFVEMNNPGVWILGAVSDNERNAGRMGIVVEYAEMAGKPVWHAPAFSPWSYASFSEDIPQTKLDDDQVVPMVIDRGDFDQNGMETWTINGITYDGRPFPLTRGRRYRLALQNRTDEDHPLHLHRFPFEITRLNGRAVGGLRKDVAVLSRYAQLDLDFVANKPGRVLFHCHQQMHMEAGFKKLFEVS